MGCGTSSGNQDVLKVLFERNSRKSTQLLQDNVNMVNTALTYEELQNKWASQVIQNVISTQFHAQMANKSISLVGYLFHELGYELKSTILFSFDLLLSKIIFDLKKIKPTADNTDITANMMSMLHAYKKYWTILSRLQINTKVFVKLPFLLLCSASELYHIFTSITNMTAGTESFIWWDQLTKQDIEAFSSFSSYLESHAEGATTMGSSALLDLNKSKRRSMKLQLDLFNKSNPYLANYQATVFHLFQQEMEQDIKEIIDLYRRKDKQGNRQSKQEQTTQQSRDNQFKFMQANQFIAQVDDICTGTILSQQTLNEQSIRNIQFDQIESSQQKVEVEDEAELQVAKEVGKFEEERVAQDEEYEINFILSTNCDEDLIPSVYFPTPTTNAQSFMVSKANKYFSLDSNK